MTLVTNDSENHGYQKPYGWKSSVKDVIIRHPHGAQLRPNPKNHILIDHKGGLGDWSKWNVVSAKEHYSTNKNFLFHFYNQNEKNQNTNNNNNNNNNNKNDDDDDDDDDNNNNNNNNNDKSNETNNESNNNNNETNSKHDLNGTTKLNSNKNNEYETKTDNNNNKNNNSNNKLNKVLLQNYKTQKFLRITKNGDEFNMDGEGSIYCEFIVHHFDDGIELESAYFTGSFLRIRPHEGVVIGTKSPHYENRLSFFVRGQPEDGGLFTQPYLFKKDDIVIIRHPLQTSISVIEKNKVSINGKKGAKSQWETKLSDNGTIIELCNVEFKQYLCISNDKKVTLSDSSTKFTKFRVDVVTKPNIVKLESVQIQGAYIGVRDSLTVGKGGPHSQMTILRKQ